MTSNRREMKRRDEEGSERGVEDVIAIFAGHSYPLMPPASHFNSTSNTLCN